MPENKCRRCGGTRCTYCLGTGKKLFEIGEPVVWFNTDHAIGTQDTIDSYTPYLNKVYCVTALMSIGMSLGKLSCNDYYYVGIDAEMPNVPGGPNVPTMLVYDVNLRRATRDEEEGWIAREQSWIAKLKKAEREANARA